MERITRRIIGRRREIKAILAALMAGRNILLEGPPGTTKSTILRIIAEESGVPFYIVEGSADLTPQKLVGIFNPSKVIHEGFKPENFEPGPLVKAMQEGGILYIEEFNRMPEETANVLIRATEEREIAIPRYGTVKAKPSFRVICAMNPYDDVGTTRLSRALMDRFCRLRLDYQSREEEIKIVKAKTGIEDSYLVELAVDIARRTREHPALRMGASVRGAIDMVLIAHGMRALKGSELTLDELLDAAILAMSSKIWVEDPEVQPEEVIRQVFFEVIRGREEDLIREKKERARRDLSSMDSEDPRDPDGLMGEVRHLVKHASIAPRAVSLRLNLRPDLLLTALKLDIGRGSLEGLELFARTYDFLERGLRELAKKYALRIILRIASHAVGKARRGPLCTEAFNWDSDDIDIDRTIEKMLEGYHYNLDSEELMVYKRERRRRCYALIIDRSISMSGYKIILAALTGATLAYATRDLDDYCVLAFNTKVTFLKRLREHMDAETIVNRILGLEAYGYTDIASALKEAYMELRKGVSECVAVLITDGEWTAGDNPLKVAPLYKQLNVIAVPSKWRGFARAIAIRGHGRYALATSLRDVPRIVRTIIEGR